jgi:CRP-like cAMP-binding protein
MQNTDLSLKKSDIDLFGNLDESEFAVLKDLFHYKKYKKGDFIIIENDKVDHIYFIRSGLVKLSYFDDDSREFILSFAYENWWETDFPAFYNRTKSTLTLQCIENTETYCLSFDDFIMMLEKFDLSKYFL